MVKKSNDKFYAICDVCGSVNISNSDRYKDYISGINKTSLCDKCFKLHYNIEGVVDRIMDRSIYKIS
jgi:hypothetical protein